MVEANQKLSRGGLTADLILVAELNQLWELACLLPQKSRALRCWQLNSVKIVGAGLLAKAVGQSAYL